MAEPYGGSEPQRGVLEPGLPNSLRSVWLRITAAAWLVAVALVALASVTILTREPRLFTLAELLPPDESLVSAFIPGTVALGVALVLAVRLRRIPAAVRLDATGVSIFSHRTGSSERFDWGALTAVATGSRWEGRELRVGTRQGWFVSLELADAIESRWRSSSRSATAG